MSVELICETATKVTYQVTISLSGSMLEAEEAIEQKLNEIGLAATQKKLETFDTDGSPIMMQMHDDGWREAMCGSIAFYDKKGERMHTIYLGATPEYGKETFHETMLREVNRVKEKFPDVPMIGLTDGAKDNGSFLEPRSRTDKSSTFGSGVTESACKLLIKSRFCKSGARWKDDSARAMMSIRSLRLTEGRWKSFWKKIDQYRFYRAPRIIFFFPDKASMANHVIEDSIF